MDKTQRIAVVMGGPSTEAEISRRTGTAIAGALREKGYSVTELELNPERFMQDLRDEKIQVVFNAVHGLYGEDGRLQSILESMGIPYTGSGVTACAVSMDKSATKRFLAAEGISTPKFLIFNKRFDGDCYTIVSKIKDTFRLPVVIKAASQGSSIGVEIVKSSEDIAGAVDSCFSYCENIVVEEFVAGKELTCAVVEKSGVLTALPIVWIAPHSGAYDFHSKYTKGATDYYCPAPLAEEVTKAVQEAAVRTYRVLGLSGVARIDLILGADGVPYVLEANTVPGMTATSLVPKMAVAMGMGFSELCESILLSAK